MFNADIRKTVLLGATWVYEGGVMQVRARDEIFRVQDLKGKKIGITKSLNTIKNDWWRIQEHMGIINILKLHGMTIDDVELVEFPYADDWYDDPAMLVPPMNNPSELWLRRDHKHDYAFRPLEKALLDGTVDAIYNQMGQLGQLSEATGQIKAIYDLANHPDWTMQVANTPAVITCTDVMAKEHPELVLAYMRAMVKVGLWSNRNKHAAGEILNRQTFYLDAEHTYEGIKDVDMVPSLSAQNLECVKIGKDFMLKHGYIKNDFDVDEWAQPKFLEQAFSRFLKRNGSAGAGASCPPVAGSKRRVRDWADEDQSVGTSRPKPVDWHRYSKFSAGRNPTGKQGAKIGDAQIPDSHDSNGACRSSSQIWRQKPKASIANSLMA